MACSRCDGTGWQATVHNGVRRVERCACWGDRVTSALLADARIPPRYAKCSLENFVLYPNEKLAGAIRYAKTFVEQFPAVQRGFCLVGPPGIGKSHIAASVVRQLAQEKRVRGLFYDVRELLKVIRSTYNPVVKTAEMDVLRPVMTAELLVLDDIGAEKPSEWVEETLNLIVNTRYNERLPTILTSNFEDTPDETNLDSLKVRLGYRMYSRIHEMCEVISYDGGDYRFMPTNGGPSDLSILWERRKKKPRGSELPSRTQGPARAQLREPREPRELKWPGGKAGRS